MPEDFFADGFGQQQGIVFTKQENQFLQKKIVFLDPMKTYQISIAKVLALLKYTKLDPQSIKKILQNSCANGIGQKVITHDEMKKIFRGVALKQNKMEPSKINIEANIKTKMPIFYDDDDSSEEQQSQQPPPQPPTKAQQQPKKPPQQAPTPTNQPPKAVQAPNDPMKAFDEYWKNLKTKNNLIDGSEVKKLFSNNNLNKSNLSKAWKLCNLSQKGSLTKGQFFIFMNLINSSNIPQALTKQMKDFIVKIQQACGYKKSSSQPSGQRIASGPIPSQKLTAERRPSSDAFDKFGEDSLFVKNASKVQDTKIAKNSSNIFPASTTNVQTVKKSSTTNVPPSNNGDQSALLLLQKVQNLSKKQKVQEKQIQGIIGNNEQLVAGLGAIEQFLAAVEKNMQSTTVQIQTLKQSQHSLNERLNNVCLQFKNIITKQTECINFMRESMHAQNESNNSRLQILENYTAQMLSIAESTLQQSQNETIMMRNQTEESYNKVANLAQGLGQKLTGRSEQTGINQYSPPPGQLSHRQNHPSPTTHEYGHQEDPFEDNEQHEVNNNNNKAIPQYPQQIMKKASQSVPIQSEKRQQNNQEQHTQNEQQQNHIYLENMSREERIKTKQMLLIRILNSVSSMNEEEYAQVVNKVVAMSQQQMNQSYTKLHALYLQSLAKNPTLPKYTVPTPEEFTMTVDE